MKDLLAPAVLWLLVAVMFVMILVGPTGSVRVNIPGHPEYRYAVAENGKVHNGDMGVVTVFEKGGQIWTTSRICFPRKPPTERTYPSDEGETLLWEYFYGSP